MGELMGIIVAGAIGLFLVVVSAIGFARREVRVQVQDEVHVLDGRAANLVSTVGLVAGVLTVLGVAGYMASLVPFVVSFVVAVAAPLAWLAAVSRARLMPKG